MKRGTPDHPKTKRLCRALGIGIAQAVGHLELLWHFTAKFAQTGDVGRFADDEIEEACGWTGEAGKLVSGLTTAGWLDACEKHRLVVHGWCDHADESVKKHWQRNNLRACHDGVETCPAVVQTCPDKIRLPEPLPEPVPEPLEEESSAAKPPPDAARKRPKPVAPEKHPEALVFAEKFLRALGAAHTDPPIKLPTESAFAGWQRDARRMLTTDGRSFEDAKRVAAWLFNDTGQDAAFWRKNILSVGTFRKQFDRLAAAMKTPPHGGRDEFHGSKILRYLATQPPADPRPRAGGTVQDPEPPVRSVAELAAGER